MATKKRRAPRKKTTARKRTRTLSAAPKRRRTVKRVGRRKKGMLSELFNPAMAKGGATAVLSGAIGGAGYGLLTKVLPELTTAKKIGFAAVGSFVTATVLQKPNLAAGIMGGAVFHTMQTQGMLAEKNMQAYKYANSVKALPMVLDENGSELYLSQDDNMFLSENIMDLAEATDYQVQLAPPFGGM